MVCVQEDMKLDFRSEDFDGTKNLKQMAIYYNATSKKMSQH